MIFLIFGLLLFLGVHSISIIAPEKRRNYIEEKGKNAWMIPYTVLSLLGFGLIIWGYGIVRQEPIFLYQLPLGVGHLTSLLMFFALLCMVSSQLSGKLAGRLKHPQLVAVKIWAFAHLLANGDLGSVLLFGGFLAWAVASRVSLKRRVALGLASDNPGGLLVKDGLALLVAFGVYMVFVLFAHEFLFGVAPFG